MFPVHRVPYGNPHIVLYAVVPAVYLAQKVFAGNLIGLKIPLRRDQADQFPEVTVDCFPAKPALGIADINQPYGNMAAERFLFPGRPHGRPAERFMKHESDPDGMICRQLFSVFPGEIQPALRQHLIPLRKPRIGLRFFPHRPVIGIGFMIDRSMGIPGQDLSRRAYRKKMPLRIETVILIRLCKARDEHSMRAVVRVEFKLGFQDRFPRNAALDGKKSAAISFSCFWVSFLPDAARASPDRPVRTRTRQTAADRSRRPPPGFRNEGCCILMVFSLTHMGSGSRRPSSAPAAGNGAAQDRLIPRLLLHYTPFALPAQGKPAWHFCKLYLHFSKKLTAK